VELGSGRITKKKNHQAREDEQIAEGSPLNLNAFTSFLKRAT
jgi:hypothetical protein